MTGYREGTTVSLTKYGSVADAFAARVAEQPDRPAVILPGPAGTVELSFAELYRRGQVRAGWLADRLRPGDRVVLALPTGPEFAEAWVACLASGLVAVPVPVPSGGRGDDRVAAIVHDCDPGLVLVTTRDAAAITTWMGSIGSAVPVAAVEPLPADLPPYAGPAPGRRDLAVLQYTSGSIAEPKGVMVEHGNILANVEALRVHSAIGPTDRFGGWLPLFHDMGLFALMTIPLLLGTGAALIPAATFVRYPVEWLRLLHQYRVTHTPAPSFAFDLCLRRITDEDLATLDLSHVRELYNGSEPIHPGTVRAFVRRFAAAGLRPEAVTAAYGMAEATLFVATEENHVPPTTLVVDPVAAAEGELRPVGGTGTGREYMVCGPPAGAEARIVDPVSLAEVPAGRTGEIWLRGGSVARGYWRRPDATAATFDVTGADGSGGWLRTGDLGAMVGGKLVVTGRLKEMLIVRGRNLFPQDVEREVRDAHPALTGLVGAAFGVDAPDERIVVVHEVSPHAAAADLPAIAGEMRGRLTRALGATGNVVLVRRGSVLRTTSGKIRRTAMRTMFLAGELRMMHADLEPAVRDILTEPARHPALQGENR